MDFIIDQAFQLQQVTWPGRNGDNPPAGLNDARQLLCFARRIDTHHGVHTRLLKRQAVAGSHAERYR